MNAAGFSEVRQLKGGALQFLREFGPGPSTELSKINAREAAWWRGDLYVFDRRVILRPRSGGGPLQMLDGAAQCFRCRSPLLPEETASPFYVVGASCPFCVTSTSSYINNQKLF
jgi:UPF0176 protein